MSNDTHHPTPLAQPRRRFIATLLGAMSASVAGLLGVPLAGFFALPALRPRKVTWAEVGPVERFEVGRVAFVLLRPLTGGAWPEETPKMAVFVTRRADGSFEVFHTHCTHVGCPISWNAGAQRFFSPCHGGVFDADGRVLAGPPPRPLDRHEWKVENGVLYAGRIYMVNDHLERIGWYHT